MHCGLYWAIFFIYMLKCCKLCTHSADEQKAHCRHSCINYILYVNADVEKSLPLLRSGGTRLPHYLINQLV
jgi:hypothetical protein